MPLFPLFYISYGYYVFLLSIIYGNKSAVVGEFYLPI